LGVVPSFPPRVNKRFWWKHELGGIKGSSIDSTRGYPIESIDTGGEGGIPESQIQKTNKTEEVLVFSAT
jgi:hypothetical protein